MRSFHKREMYFPPNAVKVVDKNSDAVVYLYNTSSKQGANPAVAFFCGKRQKPDNRYRYANEAQREKAVIKYFEGRQAALERKKEYNAKRNVASTLEVGHILTGSWGYDQTNPEAVEVVEVIGKNTVMIREIGFTQDDSQSEGGSSMSNYVIPNPGDYKSEPRKAKVQYGNSVKINDHCTGSIWNGRSQYNSWYA